MLLDTSGLVSLFDESDLLHQSARVLYDAATSRMTHSCVLAEFVPLCHARGLNRAATLAFLSGVLDSPDVEIVWVDESMHRSALELLQERPDKRYSLCDGVSFLLMRQRGIRESLTTDRHFEQEGFVRLLKP